MENNNKLFALAEQLSSARWYVSGVAPSMITKNDRMEETKSVTKKEKKKCKESSVIKWSPNHHVVSFASE